MNATVIASTQAKNELVTFKNDTIVVSHYIISEKTGIDKSSVSSLIRTHSGDLKDFGALGFEIHVLPAGPGTAKAKEYFLNEQQATLLMTYLRNNEVVREFKKNLVRAFFELRNNQQQTVLPPKKLNIKNLTREELENFAEYILERYHDENENHIYFKQCAENWFKNMNQAIDQNLSMKDELELLKKEKEKLKQLALNTSTKESEYLAESFEQVGRDFGLSRNKVFEFARLFRMIKKNNSPTKVYKDKFTVVDSQYKTNSGIRLYKQTMFLPEGKEIFKQKLKNLFSEQKILSI